MYVPPPLLVSALLQVSSGCWITSDYPVQRIVLEYLWLWITAFLNFILYIPLALVLFFNATVVIKGGRVRFVKNPMSWRDDGRAEKTVAVKMLVYVDPHVALRAEPHVSQLSRRVYYHRM